MRRPAVALLLCAALAMAGSAPLAAKDKPAKAKAPAGQQAESGDQGGGAGLNFADQKSGTPLEIYADQGLELSQDAKTVIARVNAKAIRGRVTVTGDVMVAHYRDKKAAPGAAGADQPAAKPAKRAKPAAAGDAPGGDQGADRAGEQSSSSEIWRVEADGHVTIATETETAYGDHADYNIDDAVVVLTGKNLRLVTPTDVITARDSLEYWEHRQQAVARGSAVAVRAEKRIQADVLVADFGENAQKQMAMQRAHGYDHVILTTAREVVTGDRADYNAETGIVTISGSVKMTRDNNQLDGGYAVVNLDTGISRLYPVAPGQAEPGASDQRVKGLFVPQKKGAAAGSAAAPAAGASAPPPAAQPSADGAQPAKAR